METPGQEAAGREDRMEEKGSETEEVNHMAVRKDKKSGKWLVDVWVGVHRVSEAASRQADRRADGEGSEGERDSGGIPGHP